MAGSGSMTTNKATTPASTTAEKSMFLFYEDKKKQWLVGPTLGATKGVNFSTTEKTMAKCPEETVVGRTYTWSYKRSQFQYHRENHGKMSRRSFSIWNMAEKSTILGRFKKESTLKMACAT